MLGSAFERLKNPHLPHLLPFEHWNLKFGVQQLDFDVSDNLEKDCHHPGGLIERTLNVSHVN